MNSVGQNDFGIFNPAGDEIVNAQGDAIVPVSFWDQHKVKVLAGLGVFAVVSSIALAIFCWPVILGGALAATSVGLLASLPLAAKIGLVAGTAVLGIVCALAVWKLSKKPDTILYDHEGYNSLQRSYHFAFHSDAARSEYVSRGLKPEGKQKIAFAFTFDEYDQRLSAREGVRFY